MYKIRVFWLEYIGFPLATAFSLKYNVVALDIYQERVNELNKVFENLDFSNLENTIVYNIKSILDSNDDKL